MDEKKRILTLLDKLEQYYKDIQEYLPATYNEYSANVEKRGFMERRLQLAIEVCIDVSQLLVKSLKLGLPDKEESIFDKLFEKKIISVTLRDKLKAMKRFRNVLIHHYVNLEDDLIYKHAQEDIADFKLFTKEILTFLRKSS